MPARTIFTPRPPVNLFENAKAVLGTTYQPLVEPKLFAQVDEQQQVTALRETAAVITKIAITNTAAQARTVDFQVRSSRRINYSTTVTAIEGQNWVRIDRRDRPRTGGSSAYVFDWSDSPPTLVVPEPDPVNDNGLAVSWTDDAAYLAAAFSTASQFRIYDAGDGFSTVYTSPAIEGDVARVFHLAWSRDGRYLAVTYRVAVGASHPFIKVFDFADITDPVEVTLPSAASLVTQQTSVVDWGGPDNRYLIIGRAGSNRIVIYDWDSGSPVVASALASSILSAGVPGGILDTRFSPDGTYLAVAHSTGDRLTLFTWPTATTVAKVQNSIFATNTARAVPMRGIGWSEDSRYLGVLSAQSLATPFTVYDFDDGIEVRPAPAPIPNLPSLTQIALSPDGQYVVAGHAESQRYVYYLSDLPYLLLWDYDTGAPVRQINAIQGKGRVNDLTFSPGGAFLAVAGLNYDRFSPPTGVDNVRLEDIAGTNFMVNGSFEDTTGLTRELFGFSAITNIPGWFGQTPEGVTERIFLVDRRFGNAFPTDGRIYLDPVSQYAAGDALLGTNSVRLRQNFDNLVAGATYRLSLDVTSSINSAVGVRVLWNGAAVLFEDDTDLPVIEDYTVLSITVPPGETVHAPLEKFMLAYGDVLQAKASGANVSAVLSYVLNTREATETAGLPASQEEDGQ